MWSKAITRMTPDMAMETWEEIPASALVAGKPVQHGHYVLNAEGLGLTAGIWDCTPMTTKLEPYSVDEFMLVLEGSVTMVLEDGSETTVKAGETFVIPRGLKCQWKQSEYVKKFFVIFDDPMSKVPPSPVTAKVVLPKSGAKLEAVDLNDPKQFIGDMPSQSDHIFYEDFTGQFSVGLWQSSAFERPVQPFNRFELMHILEGEVTLTDGAGKGQTFKAGDTAFVSKGVDYKWKSTGPVKKFFCTFMPNG